MLILKFNVLLKQAFKRLLHTKGHTNNHSPDCLKEVYQASLTSLGRSCTTEELLQRKPFCVCCLSQLHMVVEHTTWLLLRALHSKKKHTGGCGLSDNLAPSHLRLFRLKTNTGSKLETSAIDLGQVIHMVPSNTFQGLSHVR